MYDFGSVRFVLQQHALLFRLLLLFIYARSVYAFICKSVSGFAWLSFFFSSFFYRSFFHEVFFLLNEKFNFTCIICYENIVGVLMCWCDCRSTIGNSSMQFDYIFWWQNKKKDGENKMRKKEYEAPTKWMSAKEAYKWNQHSCWKCVLSKIDLAFLWDSSHSQYSISSPWKRSFRFYF